MAQNSAAVTPELSDQIQEVEVMGIEKEEGRGAERGERGRAVVDIN